MSGEAVELKPCPFCGGEAELDWIDNDAPLAIVSCGECPASVEICGKHGYREHYEAQAIAAWNTRLNSAPAASPVGEVGERAREMLAEAWREAGLKRHQHAFSLEQQQLILRALVKALSTPDGYARVEALETCVRQCGEKFRLYATLHAEKGTLEGNARAAANRKMAEMCEQALSPKTGRGDG